jgi:uncharacterized protein with von Willebrand factor type A (vWA) domain
MFSVIVVSIKDIAMFIWMFSVIVVFIKDIAMFIWIKPTHKHNMKSAKSLNRQIIETTFFSMDTHTLDIVT